MKSVQPQRWKKPLLAVLCAAVVILPACKKKEETSPVANGSAAAAATATATASPSASVSASPTAGQAAGQAAGQDNGSTAPVTFSEKDEYTDWTKENPVTIALSGAKADIQGAGAKWKDRTVEITAAGVYVVSGKWEDGQIIVDAPKEDTVRLVLNGVELQSGSSAPIYVKQADKLILSLQEGTTNVLSDAKEYVLPDPQSDEPNAAIYSKDDLTINGKGALTVRGKNNNGITGRDDLVIMEGTIAVTAADDGIVGRELLAVRAGTITVEAGGDGMRATDDSEDGKGMIAIADGTFRIQSGSDGIEAVSALQIRGGIFTIDAGDDGLHADTAVAISGGTIDITDSYEGMEGSAITVSGGEIKIRASDDGVNIAGGVDGSSTGGRPGQNGFSAAASGNKLEITGGTLHVNADGDGLDSNGSISMSGGTVFVNGPTANNNAPLDYDGTFDMTGGLLIAAGSAGMALAPSEQSVQASILMTYSETQKAGTVVELMNKDGGTLTSMKPEKSFQSIVISTPGLKKDASYALYTGGEKMVEFMAANATAVTWLNESGVTTGRSGGPGGVRGGGGPGGMGGARTPNGVEPNANGPLPR